MAFVRLAAINLLLAAFLFLEGASFNAVHNQARMPVKARIQPPSSHLFGKPRSAPSALFMTDDSKEPEGTDTEKPEATSQDDNDSGDEKRSVTRTVLLTVPLFCKFVVVLLIKFVTDLIVFPLLFLYRLAGIAKRRVLKMIGKGPDKTDKPNGAT
jgi:hypothetical protein